MSYAYLFKYIIIGDTGTKTKFFIIILKIKIMFLKNTLYKKKIITIKHNSI